MKTLVSIDIIVIHGVICVFGEDIHREIETQYQIFLRSFTLILVSFIISNHTEKRCISKDILSQNIF
jgi:hypothetical protein